MSVGGVTFLFELFRSVATVTHNALPTYEYGSELLSLEFLRIIQLLHHQKP